MANKRISAKDREGKDSLFTRTLEDVNKETCKPVNNITNLQETKTRRQTYFLTEELIRAISLKSAFEQRDKSDIVREAIKSYIEDKYFSLD